ncbi:MAG: DUF4388 domain-containing protein [bacterium]|nr:DUF4388 domain-containing protein [bacterium]
MKGELRSKDDLPNIIGFIAQTEKTGVLVLNRKNDKIEIGFIKGNVNGAVYTRGGIQELIKEYLVNSGKISVEDFKRVIEMHRETKLPLEKILIDEKYVDQEKLKEIINFKIQEIFDELFTWDNGIYEFIEDLIMYPNSIVKVSINTQALMMEGMRRMDEWPNIKAILPAKDIFFKKIDNVKIPENIGNEEKRVYNLITPEKSLGDLVRTSGLGKFLTYQAVYNLLKMNLIEKTKRVETKEEKKEVKPKVLVDLKVIINWILLIILAIVLTVAGFFAKRFYTTIFSYPFIKYRATDQYMLENVDNILTVFFLKYKRYPESLKELVELKWADEKIVQRFFYMRTEFGYVLRPLDE